MILAAGKAEGFTPVSVPVALPKGAIAGVTLVVFREGYVAARVWEEHKYCAMDVGVWGSFVKENNFKKRLADSFKAETVSAFRVVVGGMYGSSTWRDDIDTIGPQIMKRPSCDFPEEKDDDQYPKRVPHHRLDTIVDMALNWLFNVLSWI